MSSIGGGYKGRCVGLLVVPDTLELPMALSCLSPFRILECHGGSTFLVETPVFTCWVDGRLPEYTLGVTGVPGRPDKLRLMIVGLVLEGLPTINIIVPFLEYKRMERPTPITEVNTYWYDSS